MKIKTRFALGMYPKLNNYTKSNTQKLVGVILQHY